LLAFAPPTLGDGRPAHSPGADCQATDPGTESGAVMVNVFGGGRAIVATSRRHHAERQIANMQFKERFRVTPTTMFQERAY